MGNPKLTVLYKYISQPSWEVNVRNVVSAHFAVCLHLPFIVSTNNRDWRNKAKKQIPWKLSLMITCQAF